MVLPWIIIFYSNPCHRVLMWCRSSHLNQTVNRWPLIVHPSFSMCPTWDAVVWPVELLNTQHLEQSWLEIFPWNWVLLEKCCSIKLEMPCANSSGLKNFCRNTGRILSETRPGSLPARLVGCWRSAAPGQFCHARASRLPTLEHQPRHP